MASKEEIKNLLTSLFIVEGINLNTINAQPKLLLTNKISFI